MLVSRLDRPPVPGPSLALAYALLLLAGAFGCHRFHLGHRATGLSMLALLVGGLLTAPFLIGLIPLMVLGLWLVLDLFLLPGLVRRAGMQRPHERRRRYEVPEFARHAS